MEQTQTLYASQPERPTNATSALEIDPRFRKKSHLTIYCAQCQKSEKSTANPSNILLDDSSTTIELASHCLPIMPKKEQDSFLNCSCSVFYYCSSGCEHLYQRNGHRKSCKILSRFKGKSFNVQYANLVMKDEYLACKGSFNTVTHEMRAHIYEQVLDEYLSRYEEIKAMGMSTDVGVQAQQDFILVKMRIPFLLAALGYDDLAATELAMAMDFTGKATRTPRTKFDNLLQDLLDERRVTFDTWPSCFLLPLLLIKLRLVHVWKTYSTFVHTNIFPEDVRICIGEFLMGHKVLPATAERYTDQKSQVRTIVALIKEQDDTVESIAGNSSSLIDDEGNVQDMISCIFENDDHGFNDFGLFQLYRECFQLPESMRKLTTAFILEEPIEEGPDLFWERNSARLNNT